MRPLCNSDHVVMTRSEELADNLQKVQAQLDQACDQVGRNRNEVTLIAVSKTWPASDVAILSELGQRDFGESKEQEGHRKADELADVDLTWHFIGQIQRNKAKRIAEWADVLHSVDRPELIPLLGQRSVLIQVNLDQGTGRGGVAPDEVLALAQRIADSPLTLRGLMAVAPLHADPDQTFARLQTLHHLLMEKYPSAQWLSAGMSGDFASAIKHGATHVRIGTSILGSRLALE